MRIESTVAVVAAALLAGACSRRAAPTPEFTAIRQGLPKWLADETKLAWSSSGGSAGDRDAHSCEYDFNVIDVPPSRSSAQHADTARELWVRSQVDRAVLLEALRKRILSVLGSNGCRETGRGETGEGKSLQAFTIRFQSDLDVGGIEVATYETSRDGLTVHLNLWEADR